MRALLIWGGVALASVLPLVLAGYSPLLAWRQPMYILSGFAGILGLGLMLVQPLAVAGMLPGLGGAAGRRAHRWIGALIVLAVIVHVAGLWITSPPDVVDALLFTSPTWFTPFGVVAMWAVFGAAALVAARRGLPLRVWRRAHAALVSVAVLGTVVHALQIEGTMEPASKWLLSVAVLVTLAVVLWRRGLVRLPR